MNHSDWLQLKSEGNFVAAIIRAAGYRITQLIQQTLNQHRGEGR